MDDKEELMKALECCIEHNPDDRPRCSECPLLLAEKCVNRLKFTALNLIRKQEETIRIREEEIKAYIAENKRIMKMNEELGRKTERREDADKLLASAEKDLAKADTTIQQSMVETLSKRALAKAILAIAKEFTE